MFMAHRLLHRRLAQASSRLKELRTELVVVEDQMSHVVDEADDKAMRALVSETPSADFEYRDAKRHADAMKRNHQKIVSEIADLERKINELLDRMKESRT